MTISIFEIEAAKKEAAEEAEQLEYLQRVISDNIGLTEQNKQLTIEVQMLTLTGDQLMEEIKAANRRNEEMKGQPHMKKIYDLEQENDHLRLNLKEAYSVDRAKDKKIEELKLNQMSIHDRMMSNRG